MNNQPGWGFNPPSLPFPTYNYHTTVNAKDLLELDIHRKAKQALITNRSSLLVRALPDGHNGPGFSEGSNLCDAAHEVVNQINGFNRYLRGCRASLEEAGFNEADIQSWSKGVVSGLQSMIYDSVTPLVSETFAVRK